MLNCMLGLLDIDINVDRFTDRVSGSVQVLQVELVTNDVVVVDDTFGNLNKHL